MKFVVLGDLHYTQYQSEEEQAGRDHFFEVLFTHVTAQKADLVFTIGDIVHHGYRQEIQGLYEIARRCGVELLATTGNHDTASLTKAELRPYFVGGKATGDELYYAFSQAGIRFVMLDTGREMLSDVDWSGYVSPRQQKWLANEIANFKSGITGDQHLVLLGHHPVYGTTAFSTDYRLNIDNSDEVREVLGQVTSGRAVYFCGHNHVNSIAGPDASGWTYIQCNAPLVGFSFRLVTADESGLVVETIDFGLDNREIQAVLPRLHAGLSYFADFTVEQASGKLTDREWRSTSLRALAL